MGSRGEGDNGLRNSEWSPSPACTRWDSEKQELEAEASDSNIDTFGVCIAVDLKPRLRKAKKEGPFWGPPQTKTLCVYISLMLLLQQLRSNRSC